MSRFVECLVSSWMAFKWIFTSNRFLNVSGYVFFLLRSVYTFS